MLRPNDPYFRDREQFINLEMNMFSRAGSWLSLRTDNVKYGRGALTLCSNRGMRNHGRMSEGGTLFRIHPTHLGKRVPFAVQLAGPAELTLHTRYGDVRFTWASDRVLLAEGDRDMGLLWTRHTEGYELMKELFFGLKLEDQEQLLNAITSLKNGIRSTINSGS